MKFQGAVIKEQGQTFAIVVVKSHVLQNTIEADRTRGSFASIFPGVPIVLMAQNGSGVPLYRGRQDIVNFLAKIPMARIPWKDYTYS
jgi:hypothetical protein